jgi:hypothetical protein
VECSRCSTGEGQADRLRCSGCGASFHIGCIRERSKIC